MNENKYDKAAILQTIKENAAKLPLEFIVGAAIGGGLFLLTAKRNKTKNKSLRVVSSIAKTVAPLVIISILESVVNKRDLVETNPESLTD